MNASFEAAQGLIVVSVELTGPLGSSIVRLALDTGATETVINTALLVLLGYDPATAAERVQVTTGSGVEFAPRVNIQRLVALGSEKMAFPVLAHTLPTSAGVDGLLGLDFLRGQVVNIDFRKGQIALS